MAKGRRFRVWVPFGYVLTALSCAQLVGLTGEYEEEPADTGGAAGDVSQGGGGQGGARGGQGGETGGRPPTGGDAGDAGDGGSAGTGAGGDAGGGGTVTGGTGTGGAAGAGDGGTGGEMTGGTGGSGGIGPPSCEGGLANTCGPTEDSDCCASVEVPGGTFKRSNNDAYPATVRSFRLDLYEVTVARFRRFVEAFDKEDYRPAVGTGNNPNTGAEDGWEEGFTAELPVDGFALRDELSNCYDHATWPGDNDDRPINCVGWHVAFAFCIWDGGWLPTEAEWNYAAAGGENQRVFPWSVPSDDTYIDLDNASYLVFPPDSCGGDRLPGCGVTDLIPPGSRPDGNGRWGHADLSGNVYEWVRDRWGDYPADCDNCVVLSGSDARVARGGCYSNNFTLLFTAHRLPFQPQPMGEHSGIGIRCARPLKPVATAPRNKIPRVPRVAN